jgi:glycosyltransferase involved in cell wall biosynthesis
MRILYHHRTGATDAQRVHILSIVHALRAQGHAVELASLVDAEAAPVRPDAARPSALKQWVSRVRAIPLVYDLAQLAYNLYAIPWLIRRARAMGAQAIYERHAMFNLAGVAAARWLKVPVIVEVNSPQAMELAREKAITLTGLGMAVERWMLRRATAVLAVTTPLKQILVEMGVPPERIVVMPNGIDPDAFETSRPADPALRTRLGLDGRTVAGFVGWFREWHGIDRLIEAFHQTGLATQGGALLLIGDGPARPALETLIDRLGLRGHVVITGAVPHAAVPDYLALVDVAVQPAANEYCCPMKVIEYMGMAKPILAPDQPNLSELVGHDREGLLFRPGDTPALAAELARLMTDPGLRARLGPAARASVDARGFLWSANAARVVAMFEARAPLHAHPMPAALPAEA